MKFANPEWLLLIPALALGGWIWPRLQLVRPLRVAALLLTVLVLVRPQFRQLETGTDLWVLLDRSSSTADLVDKNLPEWKKLIERSKPGRDDRLFLVDYAAEVVRQQPPENIVYTANRQLTRTRLAIDSVLASAKENRPSRILLFTDGFSTEPLEGVGEKLAAQGIPLDYRLLRDPLETDYRLAKISTPPRVQVAEPFVIEIEITGTPDTTIPVSIARNGTQISQTQATLVNGRGTLKFSDRITAPGAHRYSAIITPAEDAHIGNNRSETWMEVTGGPRVLLVTSYAGDPVADVLGRQGFEVEVITEPASLHIGQLAGCRAVVFNNVPAWDIPGEILSSLPFFINAQGGGFLMAGGQHSFGAGGYFGSEIDGLLPVSMELKNEHRKLAVAMAIVMDRSGSMSASVGGSGTTKMDLANEGAARAVELLGAQDAIVVFAVDSEAHEIVPLQSVGPYRDKIRRVIRRIESTGGGIYVYNGLEAAWNELKKADYGQRHIILFTDAADSEQPAKYKRLVKEMTENSTTVSVIGLGTRGDSDAAFIEDIAKRGNGRIFFTKRPRELPNIFSQETVAVARSMFVKEPTPTSATGQWHQISSKPFSWTPTVDGYNLSYLREGATSALDTADEYRAPLIAFQNQGLGRTAAISFALGGDYSETLRAWQGYGDFLQTYTRWLMGDTMPPGIGIRHRLEGTLLSVDLLYDDSWQARFAKNPPELIIAEGTEATSPRTLTWQRMAPGHYTATTDLEEGKLIRGALKAGNSTIPFGPVIVGSSAEWALDPDRLSDLRATSVQSGGRELLELKDAWRSPTTRRFSDIRSPLLLLLLFIVLLDALVTRMGWRMPRFAMPGMFRHNAAEDHAQKAKTDASEHRRHQLRVSGKHPVEKKAPIPKTPTPPTPAPEKFETSTRRSRFDRAKRN